MDTVTIALIITTIISGIGALLAAFRKNIKRSSCCLGTVEFTPEETTPKIEIPVQPAPISPAIITIMTV